MTRKQKKALYEIVESVPEEKRTIASNLVEELVFMTDTLEKLKEKIGEFGVVELFVQGKQSFLRENPAVKSYNSMIQRYSTLYKQLTDLLPKTTPVPPENELLEFIGGKDE